MLVRDADLKRLTKFVQELHDKLFWKHRRTETVKRRGIQRIEVVYCSVKPDRQIAIAARLNSFAYFGSALAGNRFQGFFIIGQERS